jgi:REP element-mobilizing transposase RayT
MSRSLRVEVEGGWYLVISRGIERREIFRDDADRRDFLARLFALTESHEIRLHAYCLMKNHFHLQVETPKPNLTEAMQRLLSGYVVRFNLRHRRSGPLFQGRYRAILAGEHESRSSLRATHESSPLSTQHQSTNVVLKPSRLQKEFEETWEALRDRRGHPARSFAIVLSRRHTALKLKQIGEYCGGMDYAAVSQANHRMENTLRQNRDLAAAMRRIAKRITNGES